LGKGGRKIGDFGIGDKNHIAWAKAEINTLIESKDFCALKRLLFRRIRRIIFSIMRKSRKPSLLHESSHTWG